VTESWRSVVPERDRLTNTKCATVVTVAETIDCLKGFALRAAE
jgi:hypothetical protein